MAEVSVSWLNQISKVHFQIYFEAAPESGGLKTLKSSSLQALVKKVKGQYVNISVEKI